MDEFERQVNMLVAEVQNLTNQMNEQSEQFINHINRLNDYVLHLQPTPTDARRNTDARR